LPGSDLKYYNASLQQQLYAPLPLKFFVEVDGTIGYINNYDGTQGIPPYQLYFAGGPNTVRGYRDGSLDPRDTPYDHPFGGKLRTTAQSQLVFPLPVVSDNKTTRMGAFFDIGNVYATASDFRFSQLRQSTGIAFSFFTPILGLLDLSYAFPLNAKPGDQVQHFQLTFGSGF
jgi:outer membrane protein insertion porin family